MVAPWNNPSIVGRSPWDILALDDADLPGLWRLSGGKVSIKVDVKPVKGKKGAKTTNDGADPAEGTFTGSMDENEAAEFEDLWIDSLNPRKDNEEAQPFTVGYPSLNAVGITQIRITGITIPQIADDEYVVSFDWIEYFEEVKETKPRAKPASATPVTTPEIIAIDNEDIWGTEMTPANPVNIEETTPDDVWGEYTPADPDSIAAAFPY